MRSTLNAYSRRKSSQSKTSECTVLNAQTRAGDCNKIAKVSSPDPQKTNEHHLTQFFCRWLNLGRPAEKNCTEASVSLAQSTPNFWCGKPSSLSRSQKEFLWTESYSLRSPKAVPHESQKQHGIWEAHEARGVIVSTLRTHRQNSIHFKGPWWRHFSSSLAQTTGQTWGDLGFPEQSIYRSPIFCHQVPPHNQHKKTCPKSSGERRSFSLTFQTSSRAVWSTDPLVL